ncbi:MAG: MFS transporter [Steroidobacteraceae bacterium]|jgi:AAA family ATP:ADP antiporter|nr:MFS transporter [Steroidobacteraceae bacterium]
MSSAVATRGALALRPGEARAFALSFLYFFLLLASYFMVRPLRDSLAAGLGADQIKYLSTAVFLTMLAIVPVFGWLASRVPRSRLLPGIYAFFVAHLLAFAIAFRIDPEHEWVARVFYVWLGVFNMFVVSVFWSFMADVWREEQGRRLFGAIAAGGSLGGLLGPALTKLLVDDVGLGGIALVSALLLAGTLAAIAGLRRHAHDPDGAAPARLDEPVGGEILAGLSRLVRSPFLLGIAGLIVVGTLLGMVIYIEMARLVAETYATPAERTAFYAERDIWVNGISLVLQLLVVGRLTTWFGVRPTLVGAGLLAVLAFSTLAFVPVLGMLVVANVLMRATEFGVGKPARDMLYTVVDPETKYKVKNVIDTAVLRGSDVVTGWAHGALAALGLGLAGFAGVGAVLALLLVGIAWAVGTGYRRRGGT